MPIQAVAMDNTGDLRLLLASRYPLIVAEMQDERRFLDILRAAAAPAGLPVWVWTASRGLVRDGGDPQYGTADLRAALDSIAQVEGPGVFVLADAHPSLEEPQALRRLKDLAQDPRAGRTVVLSGPYRELPRELDGLALRWRLEPPGPEEMEAVVRRTVEDLALRGMPASLGEAEVRGLADALRGLSLAEAERLIHQATLRDGALSGDDVPFVRRAKADLLGVGGALELIATETETLEDVGGMDHLKEWLRLRGRALEPAAADFGLDPPRGVLLTGVPGAGKSLIARSLARTWGLPLILLDPGAIFGPYVGESEQRLRDALRTAEAMPVVLWIDEIEKGFAAGGQGDGGVSRRVLGTFLRWMQDRPPGVFVVATCNDVDALPPEMLRKGRFDEVFFVDLPGPDERAAIFRVHLSRRKRDPAGFDLAALAAASEGFSGAEIEAAVVGAMYRAYAASSELTTEEVLAELAATVPLSRSRPDDVARLRAWAADRAVAA
ncbi:MAG: AAA family ATPase [Actinobacteria bacterium]|nr:AAA family ATPase [Actinomycetota bacterium]